MFMRIKLVGASVAIGLIMFGGTAMAQQTQPDSVAPRQPAPQMRRRMRQPRPLAGMARAFRQLNLTDQQRHQVRSIVQTQFQSTQQQRQDLRQLAQKRRAGTLTPEETARAKALRQQLNQSRQGVRAQLLAVLTPEQKTQLQEMIRTRRENRGKLGPGKQPII